MWADPLVTRSIGGRSLSEQELWTEGPALLCGGPKAKKLICLNSIEMRG